MKILSKGSLAVLPEAIFIDLDDTLYRYDPAHKAGLRAVGEKLQRAFDIEPTKFVDLYKQARKTVKKRLGDNPSSRSRLLYFQEMLDLVGLGASVINILDYEQTYWQNFFRNANINDGVLGFLDEVRLREVPIILITNMTAQIQFRKLVYFELDESFDFIIVSEQIGIEKPDSRIYEAALAKLGCNGKNIWMIGDDINADMSGAKQALACKTILKANSRTLNHQDLCDVDATFDEFAELTAVLSQAK